MTGMVLVVVPCGRAKVWDRWPATGPTPAQSAYTGGPFVLNRRYAERYGDAWVILSAKYGFLRPTDEVPGPYNVTFKDRRTAPVSAATLRRQARDIGLDKYRTVLGLGGKEYRAAISQTFGGFGVKLEFPFAGLNLFQMMSQTKRAVEGP
jgi:hypothetical protein